MPKAFFCLSFQPPPVCEILLATSVWKPFLPHQFTSVDYSLLAISNQKNPAEESKLKGDLRMTVPGKQTDNLEKQTSTFQMHSLRR